MGAGFYDRFLGKLPAALRPRLLGLAHGCQRSPDPLPFDSWGMGERRKVCQEKYDAVWGAGARRFQPAPDR